MTSVADLPAGTAGLSLREALAIAANHAGPDRIDFDPGVFPPDRAATIMAILPFAVAGDDTVLDGSAAGVVIAAGASPGDVLAVTGTADTISGLTVSGGGIGVHVTGAHATVLAVVAQSSANEGILVDTVAGATLTDCRVDHAGPVAFRVTASSDVAIERAFVALSAKSGVLEGIRLEGSQRVHLLDSIVDPGTAWMINVVDTTDSDITGNILDGGDTGITVFGASTGNTIFRNVAIAPAYHGVYIDAAAGANTVLNTTCYQCPAGSEISIGPAASTETDTLLSVAATDFVDPARYDFHLVAGSPAIDAAADVGQDMLPDSPARYLGHGPDLGAVESY